MIASESSLERRGAGSLNADDIGRRQLLRAWVQRRRDLGGVLFLDLRDRSGTVQAVVHPEQKETFETLSALRPEWVVEVEGQVAKRAPENINPRMATGSLEVVVDRAKVLAESATPPFVLDAPERSSEELRLRHRALELRRPELQANFVLRHKIAHETRRFLDEKGFLEMETPILTRSTPEGARDYLVPSRVHAGRFYALPQSPQIFKQLLMVAGFERYFQIARCFRDEELRLDRQPEFTQIDLEMSFVDEADVQGLVEGMLGRVFALTGVELPDPMPRLTYAEAMARYGSDRPDLRYELPIQDLTEILAKSGFRGFRAAAESGGVIRALAIPGLGGASRKRVDGWVKIAQQHGAAGVLTLRRRDGELQFQVKKSLSADELQASAQALGLAEGDLALLAAGPAAKVAKALGALRQDIAKSEGLIPEGKNAFLWVTDFPLVEWDEEGERWNSLHHPFTSPDPRDLHLLTSDPGQVRSRAYDLVLNGCELGGGSIRIHQPEMQLRIFKLLGITPEEAETRFGFLLEALKYGAPPHGGIAFGLDRIAMLMTGASSLREVILFPKTTSATCLLTEAPARVDAVQLAELSIRSVEKKNQGKPDGENAADS